MSENDSNSMAHVRRELERVGEDQDVIDRYVRVVETFFDGFDSGGAAGAALPVLERLLRLKPLTPLTDDPAEWEDHTGISGGGEPMFQNRRDSEAFSTDGGMTYYLLSERDAAGSIDATPLHWSAPKDNADD